MSTRFAEKAQTISDKLGLNWVQANEIERALVAAFNAGVDACIKGAQTAPEAYMGTHAHHVSSHGSERQGECGIGVGTVESLPPVGPEGAQTPPALTEEESSFFNRRGPASECNGDPVEKKYRGIIDRITSASSPVPGLARPFSHDALAAWFFEYNKNTSSPLVAADKLMAAFPGLNVLRSPGTHETMWRPIETAPKDRLIELWMAPGVRWIRCYWDHICAEWRCTTPTGHLLTSKTALFWRDEPAPPHTGGTGT